MEKPDEKIGIVLEGGGMRGVYTAGVLDFLQSENFFADGVIGVSAVSYTHLTLPTICSV